MLFLVKKQKFLQHFYIYRKRSLFFFDIFHIYKNVWTGYHILFGQKGFRDRYKYRINFLVKTNLSSNNSSIFF
jgi:hypothetical protein